MDQYSKEEDYQSGPLCQATDQNSKQEEDCQSELSNTDSLEESEALDGNSSVVSAFSSEDSLAKYGHDPNVSNGSSSHAASITTANSKKLVKQRSLIPQPVKRAHTVDDLSKSDTVYMNNNKLKTVNDDGKGHSWKHDGVIRQRQCSVDINSTSANNEEARKLGQAVNSTTNKLPHGDVVTIKENISSLKRKEIAHKVHHQPNTDKDEYLTPFQRKDKLINELKAEFKMAQNTVKEREEELEFLRNVQDSMVQEVVEQKNNCIGELTKQLADIHCSHDDLTLSHAEALLSITELKQKVKNLEVCNTSTFLTAAVKFQKYLVLCTIHAVGNYQTIHEKINTIVLFIRYIFIQRASLLWAAVPQSQYSATHFGPTRKYGLHSSDAAKYVVDTVHVHTAVDHK